MKLRVVLWFIAWFISGTANAAPLVNLKVYVHNESGDPVESALVQGFFFQDQVIDNKFEASHHGITNKKGMAELSGHEEIYVDLEVTKKGFYKSKKRVNVRPGKSGEIDILLRDIRKPIAMYAKKVTNVSPGYDKTKLKQINKVGYDLIAGDYVAPYGDGVVSDLIFRTESVRRSWNDFNFKRLIIFHNKLDGITPYYFDHKESVYKGPYSAPLEGYENKWIQRFTRTPHAAEQGNIDGNRNYFIRIRTKIDKEGKIIYAHYGKIYGDFPWFTYYINPTPNDRNIEFDPKQNLFTNLKQEEKVDMP